LVADDEVDVVDASVDERIENVFENRARSGRSIGFARFAVRGRSRTPSPAANTTAECGRLADEDDVCGIWTVVSTVI